MALNAKDPVSFPYGQTGSRLHVLADNLAEAKTQKEVHVTYCRTCEWEHDTEITARYSIDCADDRYKSTQLWLDRHLHRPTLHPCNQCNNTVHREIQYRNPIDLLFFNFENVSVSVDKTIKVPGKSRSKMLRLRGIVYSSGTHYTARIIDRCEKVWFNDGMTTGSMCMLEGELSEFSPDDLTRKGDTRIVMAVYASTATSKS